MVGPASTPPDGFYPRLFALLAGGLLGFALVRMVQPFVGPILWAFLLAFLLSPLNEALRRWLGGRRGLAAVLLTVAGTLLVVAPSALLAVAFARQASDLVVRLQQVAEHYHIDQASDLLRIPLLDTLLGQVLHHLPVTAEQVQGWLVESGQGVLRSLVLASGALFAGAFGAVTGLFLTLFLLFFFLRDGQEMVQRASRLVPMAPDRKASLTAHLSSVTRALVLGMLLTSVAQGTCVGLAFLVVGLPSPVVFGVLAAVTSLVPVVGTALVWVPAVAVLVAQGRVVAAVALLVWSVAVVGSIDNIVRPMVVSGRAQISTLPVFMGLMGGLSAFGAIGMFLGPVIVALAIALLRFAEEVLADPTGQPAGR